MVYRFQMLVGLACSNLEHILNEGDVDVTDKNEYLRIVRDFSKSFSIPQGNSTWHVLHSNISKQKHHVHFSGLCYELSVYFPEQKINTQQLEDIQNNIDSIQAELEESTQDILLLEYLSKELEFMSLCVQNFELMGSAGIEECAGKILQKCITSQGKLDKKVWSKVTGVTFKVLHVLALIGAASNGVGAIADGSTWLIEKADEIKGIEMPETKMIEDLSDTKRNGTTEV